MERLIWRKIDGRNSNQLTEEEKNILSGCGQKTNIDLDTGKMSTASSDVDAYKAAFDYSGGKSDFVLLDFGIVRNLVKLDVFLNGNKIADTNCGNIELKSLIPGKMLSEHNELLVIVKEGAVRDLWIKDKGLMQYVPEDFVSVEDELPKYVTITNKTPERKISEVERKTGEVNILFSDGKALCVRLYDKGVVRLSLNRDDLRLVEEYCTEELEKNLKKEENFICENKAGFAEIKTAFSITEVFPDRVLCKDIKGNVFADMRFVCETESCCGVSMKLDREEAVFGLGENAVNGFNKRGFCEDIWVSHDFEKCDIPVPFYISSKKYGFYLNSSYHSIFDMGSRDKDHALIYTMEKTFDCFLFREDDVKKLISRFSEITGKPKLPPKWAFGFWQAGMKILSREDAENAVRQFEKLNIPIDVLCIDPLWQNDYCDLKWNDKTFPGHEEFIAFLKERNIRLVLWTSPFVNKSCDVFEEGKKINAFAGNKEGSFQNAIWWKGDEAGLLDLFDKKTVHWRGERVKELIKGGADGLKIDGGDGGDVSCELVVSGSRTGSEIHNLYPLAYAKSMQDIISECNPGKRPVTWERSGFTGSGKYPCTWGGDQLADFSGARVLIKAGQMCALAGIPFWSEDVGGFCLSDKTSEETFIRSYQWGLIAPLSRAHGQKTLPWDYSEKACAVAADYIRLRYALMPYIYSLAYAATILEENIMYPLFLDDINDRKTYGAWYQYMFGKYIMAAPIYEESNTADLSAERRVYFPQGTWYDVRTWEKTEGKTEKTVTASIEMLPMYYRGGAIIPMMENCMKAAQYNMDNLEITVIPSAKETDFTLYDDDGETYEYQSGKCNCVKITQQEKTNRQTIKIETQCEGFKTAGFFRWKFKVLTDKEAVRIGNKSVKAEKDGRFVFFEIIYHLGEALTIEME